MTETLLSKDQVQDASGTYGVEATKSGLAFEAETRTFNPPSYGQIKAALQIETTADHIPLSRAELISKEQQFKLIGNTRVIAALVTPNGAGYVPGIILPDEQDIVRVGILTAPEDLRGATAQDALRPMTTAQQAFLAKIAAMHQPDTGKHLTTQNERETINGAEIGHAVVMAVTFEPVTDIHGRVHAMVGDDGHGKHGHRDKPNQPPKLSNFSAQIAQTGATAIQSKATGNIRRNDEAPPIPLRNLAGLVILERDQIPLPDAFANLSLFDLSAGLTLAASRTQLDLPKVDIPGNFNALQESHVGGHAH